MHFSHPTDIFPFECTISVFELIPLGLALESVQAKHVGSPAPSSETRPGGPIHLTDVFPANRFYGLGSFVSVLIL